ncbi:hypothetical protein HRbin36_01343 [bacterium HR36]|uniref:Glycosyl hydrolase family 98 n=1 Tax=uncultured Planctomycetota bacterium TaxID=120965 RepID=H5S877_9BACT|nr:glycosyl hydrolase family 98 [uncultured Planctomycetota bacterium]GBD36222.1 hypothetical protein HRbin36_01343 [bacterium HR36]
MTPERTRPTHILASIATFAGIGALLALHCGSLQVTAQQVQRTPVEVRLIDGAVLRGQLQSITDKHITLQAGLERIAKPLTEVVQIAFSADSGQLGVAPEAQQAQIRLTDGTTLLAQKVLLRPQQLECQLFSGKAISLPWDRMRWVLLHAQDARARTELEQTLAKKPAQDVVLVLSRDGQAINAFSGIILGSDEKGTRLNFRLEEDVVPIDPARLRGMIFARRAESKNADGVRVMDRFGNTWVAKNIAWQNDRLRLDTYDGLSAELPYAQIATVDLSQGRLAYLSDLEPLRVEEKPILANIWHYRRDRNLAGGPISLGQRVYRKGLTVHSRTVLEYHVEGYREFRCIVGVEDSVSGPAKAVVRIEGDGRELFQATVSAGDKPRELALPIEGVVRLRLIVDYGDDLDLGDHVAFAEARVIK